VKTSASRSCLMFHGIGTPVTSMEPGEQDFWIDWGAFDSIVAKCAELPPQSDRFTFDDGNASDLEAARRMRSHGIDGSFFVLVGRIGRPGYLAAQDIAELVGLGMEVGLHGRDHVDWREADDATLFSEIDQAAQELSVICGREIGSLAIPYGAYDRRVWRYLERSKFTRIYTSDRGASAPRSRFVRRNPVMRWHTVEDVEAILRGEAPMLARLRRWVMPQIKRRI